VVVVVVIAAEVVAVVVGVCRPITVISRHQQQQLLTTASLSSARLASSAMSQTSVAGLQTLNSAKSSLVQSSVAAELEPGANIPDRSACKCPVLSVTRLVTVACLLVSFNKPDINLNIQQNSVFHY